MLTARFYEIRETMKGFWQDQFPAKVEEYRPYIEARAKQTGASILMAGAALVKHLQSIDAPGMIQALAIAATVEMIEPSPSAPSV